MELRTTWSIVNPLTNPMTQTIDKLADIDEVERFALLLAEEVYRSINNNNQPNTVKAFVRRKFEERYSELNKK